MRFALSVTRFTSFSKTDEGMISHVWCGASGTAEFGCSQVKGDVCTLDDTFNVAVIGAGYWGKKVINEYLQLARDDAKVDLSMVCDVKDENLAYCQKEFGVPEEKLSLSYKEVFSSRSVDAVHICTPNETHHEICKQALMAGKHVLLEKPMAMCAKHAWELVGLAEHKGSDSAGRPHFQVQQRLENCEGPCGPKLLWDFVLSEASMDDSHVLPSGQRHNLRFGAASY